jgi:MEDS: MEthanogen/methylotroph, DcmR Sensory domain
VLGGNVNKAGRSDSRSHRRPNDISSSYPIVTKVLSELELVEAGEHNILTFQEIEIMKEIRSRYCSDLLTKRNMAVILILYVESVDEVIADLSAIGEVDIDECIADGSLVIECDAHSLFSSTDFNFHSYITELQTQARRKGKEGLGVILDVSSLLLMDAMEELLKFESEISSSQPYLEYASLLCCYNGLLFDKLERKHREMIINNHHRKLYGIAISDNNSP